jgi:hypothetical protein
VELQISRLPIAPNDPNQEAEKRTQVIVAEPRRIKRCRTPSSAWRFLREGRAPAQYI